ncbi:NusG domain II-containing protein [Romboutsia sp. 1001713B170131_170501_G6]|uniref:NusG domain II-containing protein n=1 Tax=Romboutsia sp. 1001713B170131_170501_G6 TaxID=2787108 RepID=UPI0018AA950C|nr:NusG domain II-containing protein [Romboutsia sp. 1001713B170131_170501_G6]
MKSLKKLDIIIIVSLLILSFVPSIIFSKSLSKNYNSTYASIKVNNKFYDNVPLSSFKGENTLTIKSKHGTNDVLVKDNKIKIIKANCKDKLCIKQGEISNVGESIICLPNELIIEIKGAEKDSSSDDMILSH